MPSVGGLPWFVECYRLSLGEADMMRRPRSIAPIALFVAWAALVLFTVAHHEYWRDEVMALSFALEAPSLWQLPSAIQGDGHPALWYLLLRAAYEISGSYLVLPAVSFFIAAAAVALFLWRAPFPFALKVLFVFSTFPLYEYSVMARNYGISMLLMFGYAALSTDAPRRFVARGIALFLLANTNVHSAILVPLMAAAWFAELLWEYPPARWRDALGIVLALAGVAACIATVYPSNRLYAEGFLSRPILPDLLSAIASPGVYFPDLLAPVVTSRPWVSTVVLYLAVLGLASRLHLFIAALLGLWLEAFLFAHVYGGSPRHQGIFLAFLLSLYWIALRQQPRLLVEKVVRPTLSLGRLVAIPALLVAGVANAASLVHDDVTRDRSMAYAVGKLLRDNAQLHDAIVIAEPDYALMAVPYYAPNPTYLVREGRFGRYVRFTRRAKLETRLSDVLETARQLNNETGKPIVILIGHSLDLKDAERTVDLVYGWKFKLTKADLEAFERSTVHIASLQGAILKSESFEVYVLK
jgi:hypothetical protein